MAEELTPEWKAVYEAATKPASGVLAPAACQIVRMLCSESRPCARCQSIIYFVKINGIPHPFDANGESHWSTCPHADEFRRRRNITKRPDPQGGLFENDQPAGYPD